MAANDEFGQCSRKKLFCDGLSPCGSCAGSGKRHACFRDLDHSSESRRSHCELASSRGDLDRIAENESTVY